jgi:hypothetical protein
MLGIAQSITAAKPVDFDFLRAIPDIAVRFRDDLRFDADRYFDALTV